MKNTTQRSNQRSITKKAIPTKDTNPRLVPVGKRITELMDEKKVGVNKLGRLCNTSGAQIHNIRTGKNYGIDKFIAILEVYPDMDIRYILTGKRTKK